MKYNVLLLYILFHIPFDAFVQSLSPNTLVSAGGNFNTYNFNLSWSLGQPLNTTLSKEVYSITQGFQQPEVNILTGNISSVLNCSDIPFFVPYSATGILDSGNVFTAQLSNEYGSFTNPKNIGSFSSRVSGQIPCTLPADVSAGSGYRIRVVGSRPVFIGGDNGSNILINPLSVTFLTNNSSLYFGYSGDQQAIIKAIPSGGVPPYSVLITMDRPLFCNVLTSSGDELWTSHTGSSFHNSCIESGTNSLPPISSGTLHNPGDFFFVNVTLIQDAVITATITDAIGCSTSSSINIHAEDVRCLNGNSGNSKITICHQTGNSRTPCTKICVSESAISAHLAHGDFLGNCTNNCIVPLYSKGDSSIYGIEERGFFIFNVFPNPTNNNFILETSSGSNERINILVYDVLGKVVAKFVKQRDQLFKFGENFKAGIYLLDIRQGIYHKTIRLVKQ